MVYINPFKNLPYKVKRLHRLGKSHGMVPSRKTSYMRSKGVIPELELYDVDEACRKAGI